MVNLRLYPYQTYDVFFCEIIRNHTRFQRLSSHFCDNKVYAIWNIIRNLARFLQSSYISAITKKSFKYLTRLTKSRLILNFCYDKKTFIRNITFLNLNSIWLPSTSMLIKKSAIRNIIINLYSISETTFHSYDKK